jgi:hypothetical protein
MSRMKLKKPLQTALRTLGQGTVMVASNRRNFLMLEELGLSERFLNETPEARVWEWRLSAAGRTRLVALLEELSQTPRPR